VLYSVVECNSGILVAVQYVNRYWGGGWMLVAMPPPPPYSYYVLYTFTCSAEWLLGGWGAYWDIKSYIISLYMMACYKYWDVVAGYKV